MKRFGNDGAVRTGLLLAVISAASFGLSGSLAGGLLAVGWSPGAIVLARISVAALAVAPLALADLRGRWHLVRRQAGWVIFYGAVPVALTQFAYFSAVARMNVGPALLIEYTAPATVVIWLWLRRGERPTRRTLAGAVVCAIGLVLVLDLLAGPSLDPVGVGWALLAMMGVASYFLLGADGPADVPPIGLAGCGLVVGSLALGLLGATGLMPLHARTVTAHYAGTAVAWWLPPLALGIITAGVAYCAGIGAIRRLGSRVASFVALLEVLAGIVFAWLLLGQVPGTLQVLGAALLIAGIIAVKLGERSPAADNTRPPAGTGQDSRPAERAAGAGLP